MAYFKRADPSIADGRRVQAVANRVVALGGACALYGNNIRLFHKGSDVLLSVMADVADRWWELTVPHGLHLDALFDRPGYVAEFGGAPATGVHRLSYGTEGFSDVEIACSESMSVWAEFDRDSPLTGYADQPNWKPLAPTPMAGTAFQSGSPADVVVQNLVKDATTALTPEFIVNPALGSLPSSGGVCSGLLIEGSVSGGEITGPLAISNYMRREQLFLYLWAAYIDTAGTRGDLFFIGDIGKLPSFRNIGSYKVIIGRALLSQYDAAFSKLGYWCPYVEQGHAFGKYAVLRADVRRIDTDAVSISFPWGRLPSAPGESTPTMQGVPHVQS